MPLCIKRWKTCAAVVYCLWIVIRVAVMHNLSTAFARLIHPVMHREFSHKPLIIRVKFDLHTYQQPLQL